MFCSIEYQITVDPFHLHFLQERSVPFALIVYPTIETNIIFPSVTSLQAPPNDDVVTGSSTYTSADEINGLSGLP